MHPNGLICCAVCNNLYVMQQLNLARLVAKLHTGWLEKFYLPSVLRTKDKLLETGCDRRSRKIQHITSLLVSFHNQLPWLFGCWQIEHLYFETWHNIHICIVQNSTYHIFCLQVASISFFDLSKEIILQHIIQSSSEKTNNE